MDGLRATIIFVMQFYENLKSSVRLVHVIYCTSTFDVATCVISASSEAVL